MLTDYQIQPFSLDSYPLLKQLFHSAFKANVDLNSFTQKYDTRILGEEVIGFLAIHTQTNEPAAYYGVFPVKAIINGEEILIAQSGDTMTHTSHRKKGLFMHLAKLTFEECRNRGIEFIFGLPNTNSYHGFVNKLDWLHIDDVVRYDLKLNFKTIPIPKVFLRMNFFKGYVNYAKYILRKKISKEVTVFSNPLTAEGKILRSKEYLDYKNTGDKVFIKIDEITLWVKFADVFWIGDIYNYNKVTDTIIRKLKRIAFLLGYNTISFHINKNLKPNFLNHFKPYESEPLCYYYINNNYRNESLTITGADFDTW